MYEKWRFRDIYDDILAIVYAPLVRGANLQ